jgi:hypothetical protein
MSRARLHLDLDRLLYPLNRVFDTHSGIIGEPLGNHLGRFRLSQLESTGITSLNVVPRLANINRHRTSMGFFLRWTETSRVTGNPQFVICDSRFAIHKSDCGDRRMRPAAGARRSLADGRGVVIDEGQTMTQMRSVSAFMRSERRRRLPITT